jgi:hypothetical protein
LVVNPDGSIAKVDTMTDAEHYQPFLLQGLFLGTYEEYMIRNMKAVTWIVRGTAVQLDYTELAGAEKSDETR